MPKGPRGERRPADVIGAAIMVAKIATGEIDEFSARSRSDAPEARRSEGRPGQSRRADAQAAFRDRPRGGERALEEDRELSGVVLVPEAPFLHVIAEVEQRPDRLLILVHVIIDFNIGG